MVESKNGQFLSAVPSVLYTSSLLVDSDQGEFTSVAPKTLELGDHDVWVYAVRLTDQVRSNDVQLGFEVGHGASGSKTGSWWWLGLVVGLGMVGLGVMWKRKKDRCENAKTPQP